MYAKIKHPDVILNMIGTQKNILFVFIVFILVLASCQKDEATLDDNNKPVPTAFTYKAKFNGADWIGTQNLSLLVKKSTTSPSKEMRISTNSADGKLLTLTLLDGSTGVAGDGIALRRYALKLIGTSDAAFLHVNTNTGAVYNGAYGSVTITKSDAVAKKLTGIFDCTLYKAQGDTLKITNGVITDLPYEITEE